MPFYWRRRRKFWWPKTRHNKYRRYRRKRWPKRRGRRRRPRKPTRRRRRRRRYKVRRKKPTITVRQWQPDRIVKCKIKGFTTLVLGAEGKQLVCYTNVKTATTPPKAPGGGGFGCEQFSLESLYTEYKFRRNVWTKTNIFMDLCRYLGVKITVYRHPETDFILSYHRQPPFDISKDIYTSCHPSQMLLARHKIIIPSRSTNPRGRLKIKRFIKPPKQMLSKWFFQEHFAHFPLVMLKATACNLNYANLGCCNLNQIITFFYINPAFYVFPHWAAKKSTGPYLPYNGFPEQVYTWNLKQEQAAQATTSATDDQSFKRPINYTESISYNNGFFSKQILQAVLITTNKQHSSPTGTTPLNICRYNPNKDSGKGNTIWLVSTLANSYQKPPTDKIIIYEGLPLYLMLYGFLSYVQYMKKTPDFLLGYILAMESPALEPASQIGAEKKIIVPLDYNMVNGKAPYDEDLTKNMKTFWFPSVYNQLQGTYEVPDTIKTAIQIRDPSKQKAASLLHPWDIRHGYFTKTALKRMYENLSVDTTFDSDSEHRPKKKKKQTGPELTHPQEENEDLQRSLLSLCEESIYQEEEETTLKQLIQQQREQQRELKYNILRVISEIKERQNLLSLQTGVMF
nr:MAG: ORF1 [Torque teno midi virus]